MTHTTADSIYSGPVLHLLSMLCVSMKILSHDSAKKKTKRIQVFKCLHFYELFLSDITAVSGLKKEDKRRKGSELCWRRGRSYLVVSTVSADVKQR